MLSLINRSCQFEDSGLDPRVESNFNLVAVQTTGIVERLSTVEEDVAELSVRQAEEQDGRINEGFDFGYTLRDILSINFFFLTTENNIRFTKPGDSIQ